MTLLVLPLWKRVGLELWHLASLDRPQTLTDLTRNLTPPLAIEVCFFAFPSCAYLLISFAYYLKHHKAYVCDCNPASSMGGQW